MIIMLINIIIIQLSILSISISRIMCMIIIIIISNMISSSNSSIIIIIICSSSSGPRKRWEVLLGIRLL